MQTDIIIDGNYILSKSVFILHKNNLLYGALHKSLENSINNYKKWFPFENVYLVSDSKFKSWRKDVSQDYKSNRKKDEEIDWKFAYTAYDEFKKSIGGRVKVLEEPNIEGDDWISYLVNRSNKNGRNTIIVSNDGDIKQLINYSLDPLYINIMTNEMYNREKVFLPYNYQIFFDRVMKLPNDDIFSLNNNSEFISLFSNFLSKYEVVKINPIESLLVKVISGDKPDNIPSVYKIVKDGKSRGIGEDGAKSIYQNYINEFGEANLSDPDIFDNIADLICEKKNLSKSIMPEIVNNIKFNMRLINLSLNNLPQDVVQKMKNCYE